jgi:tetratricopeptide (TPR) repeat protein
MRRGGKGIVGEWIVLSVIAAAFLCSLAIPVGADTPSEVAMTWVQKGDNYVAQENYAEAISAYEQAIAIDPYNSSVWNRLGLAQMKSGRNEDAVVSFEKAVGLDPYYSAAWNNKGDAQTLLGRFSEAVQAYDRALAINSNDIHALVKKGNNLQEMGNPGEAMKIYEEVVRLAEREVRKHPNDAMFDASLWTTKGDALASLGRYYEALEAYQTALHINPKYEPAMMGSERANETLLRQRGTPQEVFSPAPVESEAPVPIPTPISAWTAICGFIALSTIFLVLRNR